MSKRHWFLFAAAASLVAVQACSDSDPGTSYPGNGGSGGSKAGAGGHSSTAGHAGTAHAGTGATSDAGQGGEDTGEAGAGGSDTSNAGRTNGGSGGGSGGSSTGGSAGVAGTLSNGGSGGSHAGTSGSGGSGGSAAGAGGSGGSHAGSGGSGGSGGGSAGVSGSGGASGGTAGVSGSGGSGGSGGAAATTFTLQSTTLGQVIGTANGLSLYVFKPDTPGTSSTAPVSACTGGCLLVWPIYYGNPISVPSGLLVSDFGSFDRGGNVMQSTYKGWPLYTYAGDTSPGNVNGEGLGSNWYTAKNPFVAPK